MITVSRNDERSRYEGRLDGTLVTVIDFVRDAFGHLKAIAVDQGGRALLRSANVGQDEGVVNAEDKVAFIAAARTRQWDREKSVRTLA